LIDAAEEIHGGKKGTVITRRDFVKQAGGAAGLLASTVGMTAQSYARILGANDRIRLAQLGCGACGESHVHMVYLASKQTPVETVAVCDLWSVAREHRAAQVKDLFNLKPQQCQYPEQFLSRNDIDGVMIATADFQHARLCAEVVRAGKDCYVEKPFANVLADAKEGRDAVKRSKQIVQVGTQYRSEPYHVAVRDLIRSGHIGDIVQIQQEWDFNEERWRFRDEDTGVSREMLVDEKMEWRKWLYDRPSQLREQDTDWKRWLLDKPYRPFDPHVYLEFRLYKEFSSGIIDQFLSHGCDLVHFWTGENYPVSVVSQGAISMWKDGRENPDTLITAFTYPKGFLYTYRTTLGNSYRSFSLIQGRDGTIINYGAEGASLFVVTDQGGRKELNPWEEGPVYTDVPLTTPKQDKAEIIKVPGAPSPNSIGPADDDPTHLLNWLQAMRDRKQPAATVDDGFAHSIACIMATQSYWSGKKLFWDPRSETIQDHQPN
jgi:predicted dehydrogenase